MNAYELTVTRSRQNPTYEADLKEWQSNRHYGASPDPPLQSIPERVLSVSLTEEEFLAVKRGVLEVFK